MKLKKFALLATLACAGLSGVVTSTAVMAQAKVANIVNFLSFM